MGLINLPEKLMLIEFHGLSIGDKVVLDDITCAICQEMLFEPSVLKCGHGKKFRKKLLYFFEFFLFDN